MPIARVQRVPFWNDLLPLTWQHHWTGGGSATLHNNGSGVYLALGGFTRIPTLSGGPVVGTYHLHRINFHWGPDNEHGAHHIIGDTPCAMEIHATYYNSCCDFPHPRLSYSEDLAAWAVVAMCFAEGDHNSKFESIAQNIPFIREPGSSTTVKSDCLSWLKRPKMDHGYLTYISELPGTSSRVTWIVYEEPNMLSKEQVDAFRAILKDDKNPMIENKCKLPINPLGREIVFVRDIPFFPFLKPS